MKPPSARAVVPAPCALLLAVLLPSLPSAQLGGPSSPGWPGAVLGRAHFTPLPGPMTRAVRGEMTGDLRPDAVVLVGDRPVVMFGPGLHHALRDCPRTALEIARLPRAVPDGRDALVLTSDRGLELAWIDLDTQQFVFESVGSAVWVDAPLVESVPLGGGGSGLVGLRADRQALLFLPHPRDPGSEEVLELPYTIHDVAPLQWDGAGPPEVALLTSEGLKVIDETGLELTSSASGGPGDVLAVVRRPGLGFDRLVATVELSSGFHWLFCADQNRTDAPIPLGDVSLVAMVTGDADADGLDDLLVSQQTTGQLVLFYNQGDVSAQAFTWDPGQYELLDPTEDRSGAQPAPWNHATPILADLDADGDADVLFPVEKDDAVALLRTTTIDHAQMTPVLTDGCFRYDPDTETADVSLTLEAPPVPPGPDEAIEMVVWHQATAAGPTDPVAIHHELVPLDPSWPRDVSFAFPTTLPAPDLYDVQVRLVDLAGATPSAAAPSYVYSVTASLGSMAEATGLNGVDPGDVVELELVQDGRPCHDPGGGIGGVSAMPLRNAGGEWYPVSGDEGASGVPLPCVPCFTDGYLPVEK